MFNQSTLMELKSNPDFTNMVGTDSLGNLYLVGSNTEKKENSKFVENLKINFVEFVEKFKEKMRARQIRNFGYSYYAEDYLNKTEGFPYIHGDSADDIRTSATEITNFHR